MAHGILQENAASSPLARKLLPSKLHFSPPLLSSQFSSLFVPLPLAERSDWDSVVPGKQTVPGTAPPVLPSPPRERWGGENMSALVHRGKT